MPAFFMTKRPLLSVAKSMASSATGWIKRAGPAKNPFIGMGSTFCPDALTEMPSGAIRFRKTLSVKGLVRLPPDEDIDFLFYKNQMLL